MAARLPTATRACSGWSRDLNRPTAVPGAVAAGHLAEGFSWIDANDAEGNVLSFLRFPAAGTSAGLAVSPPSARIRAGCIACIVNFPRCRTWIPGGPAPAGRWREILNTDADVYGGSGVGNLGGVKAEPEPWHGQPAPASITVPPLARSGSLRR